jgi:hypothetical protein
MRIQFSRVLACGAVLGLGVSAVSCAGGGSGGAADLVLLGFNHPNTAAVALNDPLIFAFSDNVDPTSVTPDTIQVVGSPSFTFETLVVDGNLVGELPFIPNFEDYSDSGLAPGKPYTVFLPVFPAVDTVRSTRGRPLVLAESFTFTTNPVPLFIEPRRPLTHSPGPITVPLPPPGAKGDEDGCVQNPTNSHFNAVFQTGTSSNAQLLCLKNEGPPHILLDETFPTQNQRAIGTPSAVSGGFIDLPAIRVRFNEPLDPITVVPYVPSTQKSLNVQLWRVGDTDAIAIAPVQIKTNKPLVVQDLNSTETILVAVGPQAQGTYLINVQGVKDLPGNLLDLSDRPTSADLAAGGYLTIDNGLAGLVPPGYRIYFRTLHLAATTSAIAEGFSNNFFERADQTFTRSVGAGLPADPIPTAPPFTLSQTEPGQSTTANWNGTNRFLGLASVPENTELDDGLGRLKAVFEPYLGNTDDADFDLPSGSSSLSSDGGAFNGNDVFQFNNFNVGPGATLLIHGSKPLLMLVRGTCTIDGTIKLDGGDGGPGINTDGTAKYTHPSAMLPSGLGGSTVGGNGGGGNGGKGGPKGYLPLAGDAEPGFSGATIFNVAVPGGGNFGLAGDLQDGTAANQNRGGGGGGYGTAGGAGGGGTSGGGTQGTADFALSIGSFVPERCFQPNANIMSGSGGGGGGLDNDNGASETSDGSIPVDGVGHMTGGDDGAAGGGQGGGAIWIIARSITISATGKISAKGGKGGNTYALAGQTVTVIDPTPMQPNSGDETSWVASVTDPTDVTVAKLGDGGGGGGGSGGAILLQARDSISMAGTLDVSGGAGGVMTLGTKNGGAGGQGRVGIMSMFGDATKDFTISGAFSNTGTVTPAGALGVSGAIWRPTVDMTSCGVPQWTDLLGPTATFQAPFWDSNFTFLTGAGLTQGVGGDFNAILELQGADNLLPNATTPTSATNLTAWLPSSSFALLNLKQFVRYRWKFFVNRQDAVVGNDPDFNPSVHAMPAILDFTLPFTK